MSDINSSLPIRTEGDLTEKLQTRILDGSNDANKLTVNADGSVNITDNGASLTVDAINLDIRDLVFATDKVDVSGSTVALDASTLAALESITVQNGAGASAVNIQDGGNSITVDATNLDIRDLTAATDSVKAYLNDASGNPFTAINPLPVTVTLDNAGTEINDHKQASSVAGSSTDNHDYTVTAGKTLILTQIEATSTGKAKMVVLIETGVATGIFTQKFVQFNSTAETNMGIKLASPIQIAAGVKVRVAMMNRDNQAQDLYSTICGQEI